MSKCSIDDNKLNNLLQLFLCRVKCIPSISVLDLSCNQLTVISIIGVFKVAHVTNASKIFYHIIKLKIMKSVTILHPLQQHH